MARARLVYDGRHLGAGHDRAIRVAGDDRSVDDLVRQHDEGLRGERRFLRNAPRSPELRVAVVVRSLHRDHRDIRDDRGDEPELAARERIDSLLERAVRARDVAAEKCACREVWRAEGSSEQRLRDREVRVVIDLDAARDALFHRAPVRVGESSGHVADPRRRNAPDATGADELIERDVRDRSDEMEVLPTLADHLMRESERDGRLERASERDRHPVADVAANGVTQRDDLLGRSGGARRHVRTAQRCR